MTGETLGQAIVAAAFVYGLWRVFAPMLSSKPKPPSVTPTPQSGNQPPPPPAETSHPAPKFLGFLFLKPIYDFGERIPLNPGPEAHGTGASCMAQTHGIVDNGTGPYRVKVRALVNGNQFPVYNEETGEEVSNVPVLTETSPNGKMGFKRLLTYALGKKPWTATGSLVNCGEFVPAFGSTTETAPRSCGNAPSCGPDGSQAITAQVVPVTIECTIINRFDVASAPYRQDILAATSPCGG